MAELGIDLGTTNSAVSHLRNRPEIIENQGRQTTPSIVAYEDGELMVGQAAKDNAMAPGVESVRSVKREMGTNKRFKLGDQHYTPEEISSIILKQLIEAAGERLGEPVDSAVITIPAYFSGAQKEATKKAGELADLKSVQLLAEPIAAALAYGAEDIVLVYDLGGGTFDVAIIDCFDYTMIALDGDNYLGGDNFDDRLIIHLAKAVKEKGGGDLESDPEAMAIAKEICEKAKQELSLRNQTRITFMGEVGGTPVNVSLKVTRDEFEQMIIDIVDQTIKKVENAIRLAGEKDEGFSKDDIETILLVGGSSYIPLVQRKVEEFFGKGPSKKINPDLAVSLGAAIHTASGPGKKGGHRLRFEPLAEVTANANFKVSGRTSPNAQVEIQGGASTTRGEADNTGKFGITFELNQDTINDITVTATDSEGETRKSGFEIRHDSNFTGKEEMGRRKAAGIGGGVLPRTLGIRVTGQDDILGVILPAQTDIPCSVKNRDYGITSSAPNMPGIANLEIFEGEIPYAPLNTKLASLQLQTPGSDVSEPVEISFQITEDHLLTVTALMINHPDRAVTATINCESPTGDCLNVIERSERVINMFGEKLRPEEKARINKLKQGLLDLCELYKKDNKPEYYEKIKTMGQDLKMNLNKIEALDQTV